MEPITLSQLNRKVSEVIRTTFYDLYWLTAEISDVRQNASGHCYLEFVEKNQKTQALVARAKGNIWNQTFRVLKPYFEQSTGQAFVSGIKVLVKVSVDFHELYGYALTVHDIDPAYTMGDVQRQRQLILRQLEDEGVKDMNKELEFPVLPQRIAVITSSTAAGYEDFLEQLRQNPSSFVFYPKLFPAIMQGERVEASIIEALNRIYQHKEKFDVVVIIRGGGATSDLHCFDSYLLATNCAQFPLPIITGIGHERDETVLDHIANRRAKTPTAVASLLIDAIEESYLAVWDTYDEIASLCEGKISSHATHLQNYALRLHSKVGVLLGKNKNNLEVFQSQLRGASARFIDRKTHQIGIVEQFVELSSPLRLLARGYSLTLKDGKIVRKKEDIKEGDVLETVLSDGKIASKVLPD